MKIADINEKSWEIAVGCMISNNGRFEAYSKNQIRRFFQLSKSDNFENDIKVYIRKYAPQGTMMIDEKKRINEDVGKKLIEYCKNMKPIDRLRFFQYLMWNIKIIENVNNINKLLIVLKCEKIKKPEKIKNSLKKR